MAADALASSLLVDDALAGLRIRCAIEGERFDILADPRTRVTPPGRSRPDVKVKAERQTLLALIDGETSLLEAVRSGGLDLVGPPPVLLRIAAAQRAFAEGAARVRRMEALLARYRAQKLREAM